MNIKEVSEITGLTKKAIKFYENSGLIEVNKNPTNNYREYSEDNSLKLKLIASLRMINLSIENIRLFIDGEINIKQLLEQQYDLIDKRIKELHDKKDLTLTLINNLSQTEDFVELVSALEDSLDFNELEKTDSLSGQLRRIFPGDFGDFIAVVFEPFLQIKIKDEEKKKIWLKFVSYLDDIREIPETHPTMQIIKLDLKDKLNEFEAQNQDFIKKILNQDKETINNQVSSIIQLINKLDEDLTFRKSFIMQSKLAADIPSFKEGTKFSMYLKDISPVYKEFIEKQNIIKEMADKLLGFDSQIYLEKLVSANN